MRLARLGPEGGESPFLISDGQMLDASSVTADFDPEFIAAGGMADLAGFAAASATSDWHPLDDSLRYGSPLHHVNQIICIGLNYRDHAKETGQTEPAEPIVFFKARNTLRGRDDIVLIPPGSMHTDWEVELAVVIGRRCRYLTDTTAALAAIAGYAISNDVSERHYQLERGGQWVKGKSCETFNPFGPWLATPYEVDTDHLRLELQLNGVVMQHGSTADLIFPVAHLVWYLSQFMVLEPGDVINTGTPAGVGMGQRTPRYLIPGDALELSIDGLGTQHQRVEQGQREER